VSAFLEVRDLRVSFPTDDGVVKSVDGLSFSLERGKTLGIVGESGSGKSVTSLSIMGLHKPGSVELSGEIWLDGENLVTAGADRVRRLRGQKMAMIFQDPLSSMHPFYSIGHQIIEAFRIHNDVSKQQARKRAIELLDRVGIPQPNKRVDDYPHQFSGGMRQRAMIAMALSCTPELLIADEPTTALDVTVQAQILDLIRDLQQEFNSAVMIITHDLGVVAELADDILVMYAGRVVELAVQAAEAVKCRHLVALRQGRIVEDSFDEVVYRPAEGHHCLADVDQFAGAFTDDVDAQHFSGVAMEDKFQTAGSIAANLAAGGFAVVGHAHFVGHVLVG